MGKRSEDIYGTHKVLNRPDIHKAIVSATKRTNEAFGTNASTQRVKCAISKAIIESATYHFGDTPTIVEGKLLTLVREKEFVSVFPWYEYQPAWAVGEWAESWWARFNIMYRRAYKRRTR